MCGIWGIASINGGIDNKTLTKAIKKLMVLSEIRGKEASGISILKEERLSVLRKAKASHELLKDEDFKKLIHDRILSADPGDTLIIGHSRLVTNGSQYHPENNQPVTKRNIALVHNGIIVNCDELWRGVEGLEKNSEVDTEIILELFHKYLSEGGTPDEAMKETFGKIRGMASVLGISQKRNCLTAATNNGSLYYCGSEDGNVVIFASESLIIKKLLENVPQLSSHLSGDRIQQMEQGTFMTVHRRECSLEKETEIIQDNVQEKQPVKNEFQIRSGSLEKYEIDFEKIRKIRRCKKCVLPETMPFIEFDENGICNYCRTYKKVEYKGTKALNAWSRDYLRNRENKSMVAFSGGRDSSYGLHYFVKEMGIKPIAYCYDWGMVTDLARRNQSRMCSQLGIEFVLVSADIKKKRDNIRKNVLAWLKRPNLGMIPLFMAGDKHYFYYANKVCRDYRLQHVLLATNPYEKTYFKTGFCGVKPDILNRVDNGLDVERLTVKNVIKLALFYGDQFIKNRKYINTSFLDTISAATSFYVIPHNYFRLFDYIPWEEKTVDKVLREEYGWECASDAESTWRIGDGTAPFYNYIYCLVAGFTENDTFRSNQIREGMLTREEALQLVYRDNEPRFASLKWYFDVIGLDMEMVLDIVNRMPKLYNDMHLA